MKLGIDFRRRHRHAAAIEDSHRGARGAALALVVVAVVAVRLGVELGP